MKKAPKRTGRRFRRWRARDTMLALVLALAVTVLLNLAAQRYALRLDVSRAGYYRLSRETVNLLQDITEPVSIKVFLPRGTESAGHVENLLRKYQGRSHLLEIEWLDPDRDIGRAETLMDEYEIQEPRVVVFERNGSRRYVRERELYEYDYSPMEVGGQPQRSGFSGERAFTAALRSVLDGRRPVIYFLQGHGERDPASFARRRGLAQWAREIRREHCEVRRVNFGETAGVPEDADVLVLASPARPLDEAEQRLIDRYLEEGGRVFVLLDADRRSGLEEMLRSWGVNLPPGVVVDPAATLTGREVFVSRYGDHPITSGLRGMTTILYQPRAVEPLPQATDAADRPQARVLIETGPRARIDAAPERTGPISLAVAVERGPAGAEAMGLRPTRLVVVGDSIFAANDALSGASLDLLLNSLQWLADDGTAPQLETRPLPRRRLIMDENDLNRYLLVSSGGIPLFVGLAGMLVWVRRRR